MDWLTLLLLCLALMFIAGILDDVLGSNWW
jgi:hypothetical protein